MDVLVVGLGSAGAAAAQFFARAGLKVLAVDKRPMGETGARWVNSVPQWCFERAGVAVPSGDELFGGHGTTEDHVFHLIAPGAQSQLSLKNPAVLHIDMRKLVRRLVQDAVDAGVQVLHGTISAVVLEQDRVTGVEIKTSTDVQRISTKLVVDASGLGGAIRRRVATLAKACPDPEPESRCTAAEFQYAVRDRDGLAAFLTKHHARPGHDVAFPGSAGGYSTLTIFTTVALDQVGILAGSIAATGVDDAGTLVDRFVASAPWLGERLWGGRGAIPVRRPYDTLGCAGVALIGDAACQVHASHGSGVGMGLLAARTLVDAVAKQDDPGSAASVARYTRAFHAEFGPLLCAADAFRRFVQQSSREDLTALVSRGLLDERLAMDALEQRATRPDLAMVLAMIPKAASAPGLALRFAPLALKTGLLDRLGGKAGIGNLLEKIVGKAPTVPGHGAWDLPQGKAAKSNGRD